MKTSVKMVFLLVVLIFNCCVGSAYAYFFTSIYPYPHQITTNQESVITVTVRDELNNPISGADVILKGHPLSLTPDQYPVIPQRLEPYVPAGAGTPFCIGSTDNNGRFQGVFRGSYASQSVIDIGNPCDIFAVVVYNSQLDVSTDLPVLVTRNQIPEFPSVAVPVAAILGLVVVLGRKKNKV